MANDSEVIDLMNRLSRAEARVQELENLLLEAACVGTSDHVCVCGAGRPCKEARTILAAREGKNSLNKGNQ